MTLIYLVRHGETDWNRAGLIQGSTDIPLNELGREQASASGRLFAGGHHGRRWHGIYSSPLTRALDTGKIIAAELGIAHVQPLAALVERNYGDAEGFTNREVARRYPGATEVPGRETRDAVAARVLPALMALGRRHIGEAIIVTTHGGVIRTLLDHLAPDDHAHRGSAIANGSVHSFSHADGALELVRFNDPCVTESGHRGVS